MLENGINEFNERQIHTLKAVINSALESAVNNKPLFVTSNSNSEATHDCVREYVSKYDLDHAVVIQLSNLNEEFKKQIGDVIKNEKCAERQMTKVKMTRTTRIIRQTTIQAAPKT